MADTTAPKCEPPAHLWDKAGYHTLYCETGDAWGEMAFYWVPADLWGDAPEGHAGGWTLQPLRENADVFIDFADNGYGRARYIAPVYSPSAVAALVAAGRDAVQRLNESGTGVVGLIDTIHAAAAILRPALSPFTDAPEADHE